MRQGLAVILIAIGLSSGLGVGASQAADQCGPGCHAAINGGCVVDGWQAGAPVRNECPAGAHPRPPCYAPYVWSRHAKACVNMN
jgi:hypothetical protein